MAKKPAHQARPTYVIGTPIITIVTGSNASKKLPTLMGIQVREDGKKIFELGLELTREETLKLAMALLKNLD